jgi:hypothetical protein
MLQQVLVYVILVAALLFLLKNYIFRGKKKNNCDSDCDCH